MSTRQTFAAALLAGSLLGSGLAQAQSANNLVALKGLAPVSALLTTEAGKAALKGNYDATGAIQRGEAKQPLLLPWPAQQAQALQDAFITYGNAYQLADGLGSSLGGAYQALTSVTSTDDGKTAQFTNISPAIAQLIAYSVVSTASDASSGKYFFANGTTEGTKPVSAEAKAIMAEVQGITDIFGKAYDLPAGPAPASDPYGDARPFQTEKSVTAYQAKDFFGVANSNWAYLKGPVQNLTTSPSYPSGHTTYGYTESLILAVLVPQRYPEMVVRGAEYGNDRIIVGAHYVMDVLGGRTLASYDMAHLLANDPAYLNRMLHKGPAPIADYQAAVKAAQTELASALGAKCGGTVVTCATTDTSRFKDAAANAAFYEATQTYGLPVVYPAMVGKTEDIGKLAPEAGYLLTVAFPKLSLAEADQILTETEGPGGGFLDNGSAFGVYSRLDLYKASLEARAR